MNAEQAFDAAATQNNWKLQPELLDFRRTVFMIGFDLGSKDGFETGYNQGRRETADEDEDAPSAS